MHFVNCGEPLYVAIEDKEHYLETMAIAKMQIKPMIETHSNVIAMLKKYHRNR
jgi:hypothetical protein